MLVASRLQNREQHNIAVIGDGAMTAGMAFEALNHAGHIDDNVLVVLNDNNMSISKRRRSVQLLCAHVGEQAL